MSKRLTKLLTVAAALAVTSIAGASTRSGEVPSVVVKFGDLALDKKAGVVKLHARIHAAAEFVCSSIDSRVLGLRDQYDACVSDAVAQAVSAVGNANLSNYHRHGKKAEMLASNVN